MNGHQQINSINLDFIYLLVARMDGMDVIVICIVKSNKLSTL